MLQHLYIWTDKFFTTFKKIYHNIGFEEKWQLFVVKLANIAENIHHKNNPRGQFKKGGEAENSRLRCTGWVVIFFLYICTKACIKRPSDVARKTTLRPLKALRNMARRSLDMKEPRTTLPKET
jgi:hypothetical protein